MTYKVKLFAVLKDHAGHDIWSYTSAGPLTARQLLTAFFEAFPAAAGVRQVTRLAVNQAFCTRDQELAPSDELAMIPPVSGG